MALSEDQRALLRLLLAGDTYEHVADVLGSSADDVRERAHQAASALESEGDPELPADAVNARLAVLEGAPAESSAPASTRAETGRRRLALWIVAGGAAVVLLVVLLVVVGGGGGGDDDTTIPASDQEDAVPVRLSPVGGSHANGGLTIIRVADQPAVDLDIRGLTPSAKDETYVLWFSGARGRSLPVAFQAVGANGRITGRTPIPTAATSLLPSFDTVDLTLARQHETAAAVQQAAQAGTLPERVGTSVLRGSLP
jgi:hypothetical protein